MVTRVQVGLNKGEAKHALARAVFFNRLGEVRDRSYEDQLHRYPPVSVTIDLKKVELTWISVLLAKFSYSVYVHMKISP